MSCRDKLIQRSSLGAAATPDAMDAIFKWLGAEPSEFDYNSMESTSICPETNFGGNGANVVQVSECKKYEMNITAETQEKLSNFLKPWNQKFYDLVGHDFGWK